jgi:hypothetical protein
LSGRTFWITPSSTISSKRIPARGEFDILLIMGFLWRIDPRSDWRSRSGRLLDILVDGLKAGAPGAAPA